MGQGHWRTEDEKKIALGRSGQNVIQVEGAVVLKVPRQEHAWRLWGTESVLVGLR